MDKLENKSVNTVNEEEHLARHRRGCDLAILGSRLPIAPAAIRISDGI